MAKQPTIGGKDALSRERGSKPTAHKTRARYSTKVAQVLGEPLAVVTAIALEGASWKELAERLGVSVHKAQHWGQSGVIAMRQDFETGLNTVSGERRALHDKFIERFGEDPFPGILAAGKEASKRDEQQQALVETQIEHPPDRIPVESRGGDGHRAKALLPRHGTAFPREKEGYILRSLLYTMRGLAFATYGSQKGLAQLLWPEECKTQKGLAKAQMRLATNKNRGLNIMGRVYEQGVDNTPMPDEERVFYQQLETAFGPEWYPKLAARLTWRHGKAIPNVGVPKFSPIPATQIESGAVTPPTTSPRIVPKTKGKVRPAAKKEKSPEEQALDVMRAILLEGVLLTSRLCKRFSIKEEAIAGVKDLGLAELVKLFKGGLENLPEDRRLLCVRLVRRYGNKPLEFIYPLVKPGSGVKPPDIELTLPDNEDLLTIGGAETIGLSSDRIRDVLEAVFLIGDLSSDYSIIAQRSPKELTDIRVRLWLPEALPELDNLLDENPDLIASSRDRELVSYILTYHPGKTATEVIKELRGRLPWDNQRSRTRIPLSWKRTGKARDGK